MIEPTADEILERMLKTIGSANDNALAKAVGVSAQAVSEARRKNRVPPSWAITLAKEYPASLDWLLLGRKSSRYEEDPYLEQSQTIQLTSENTDLKARNALLLAEKIDLLERITAVQQEALSLYRRLDMGVAEEPADAPASDPSVSSTSPVNE